MKEKTQDVLNMLSKDREKDEIVVKSGNKSKNGDVNVKGVRKIDLDNKQFENINNENIEYSEINKGFLESKSKIDVSLNQKSKITSEDIIKNLTENNQNYINKKDSNSKKYSKSKEEQQIVLNSSNNESIMSMKLDPDALDIKIINGIKSNNENSLLISSQNND